MKYSSLFFIKAFYYFFLHIAFKILFILRINQIC